MAKTTDVQGTQALERAVAVMKIVGIHDRSGGIRLSDITRLTRLTTPTAHRIIRALEHDGFLERDENSGLYQLGPEIFVLGTIASIRYGLDRVASQSLVRLAHETGDTALLTARRFWHGVCLNRAEGSYPIRVQIVQAGDRHPLGVTSGGLAILASLSDEEIESALEANKEELMEWPHFAPTRIREEVSVARTQGFALNRGRLIAGSWGLAVGINGPEGECVGALTIAAVERRFDDSRIAELTRLLRREVAYVENCLAEPTRIANSIDTVSPRYNNPVRR
jgi:DNA-binding IclR family transcriptional regulator